MFMAAAEVRTTWQRAANRCLVQEDATVHHLLYKVIQAVEMQPNFGYHKDFICEQLNSLEYEGDAEGAVLTNKNSSANDSGHFVAKKEDSFLNSSEVVSSVFMTRGADRTFKEINTKNYSEHSLKRKITTEDCLHKGQLLGSTVDPFALKRRVNFSLDLESPSARANKSESWWRIAGKDELSLLVAQKSLQHIENCDLPRSSQTVHVPTRKLDARIYVSCDSNIISIHCISVDVDVVVWSMDAILIYQAQGRKPPSNQTFKHDLSRSNLLDALRHSQTRARKAEMEAQKSHDENEHIIKLLFRQASHLFAYRQWLQMWQWQNLLLQHQLKDHSISTRMPLKGKHKEGSKNQKCEICKFAVAFAVGLGLVSAGLLLGWTIGCWFPPV
ncbi:hypothetical protein ZIOFF_066909 [Zingiber officinale]|uniref:Uncharacterized protein n=1 Tax=Zingiber officinale TaxID=94328 RepID=A0A8J5C5H2_ZINOF|nr:hypothetical protein ZIOFF_066909 [Zingiber officinale]